MIRYARIVKCNASFQTPFAFVAYNFCRFFLHRLPALVIHSFKNAHADVVKARVSASLYILPLKNSQKICYSTSAIF